METIKMNICGNCGVSFNPAAVRSMTLGEFSVVFCPVCGAGRTVLSSAQLAGRLNSNERFYNLPDRISTYFGRRIEFVRRYGQSLTLARKHGKTDSCLDVGCNIGYWLYFLKAEGISRAAGIELNASCAKFGREVLGLEIIEKLEDCSGRFDLITLFDVIEHLENPAAFLADTLRLAHPGSIYFIQLPNYESWMARFLGKAWPWWSVPDHLWHFTPGSAAKLLDGAGFDVAELKTCDTVYDLVEYVMPEPVRPALRLLTHLHRTSGYIYRRAGRGGLIQVVAKVRENHL